MARASFTITFDDGESHTIYANSVSIKNGFWLNEKDEKLTQTNRITSDALFGNKVKIQIITDDAKDGRKIDVEIKAKIGDEYIELTDNEEELKYSLIVKNDEAISESIYINPKWYDEAIEQYNYETHQTEIDTEKVLTFVFDAKFESQNWEHSKKNLPKEDTDKLVPISYRRNYEELIGLFNTDNSGEKSKESNYENKFISSNSEIKNIVDEFIEKVIAKDITISEIKTLVEEKATALWNAAVKQVQIGNLDDRPLYWARNKMQTWLKRNPLFKDQIDFDKSIVKKGTELDKLITLFEEKSRNYTGIDFSKAGNKKKILITGFDPFQLDFNFIQYGIGPSTFNPSGVSALSLTNGFEDYYIQTCIFPVRYEDFDKGFVENIIKSNINNVDLIMTTSLNGGDPKFDIERYAAKYRGGGTDNMFVGQSNKGGNESLFRQLSSGADSYETTLPYKKLLDDKSETTIEGNIVRFDESKSPKKGSGGSYLSNEIMYRSTRLRDQLSINKPIGHFHLGNLNDIKNNDIIIRVIKNVIKKML